MFHTILIWIHLLALLGAMGGAFFFWRITAPDATGSAEAAGRATRLANVLLGIGFLAGLALYYDKVTQALRDGYIITATFHSLVGIKLLLLLAAGAGLGIASGRARRGKIAAARTFFLLAAGFIAAAVFLGLRLRGY